METKQQTQATTIENLRLETGWKFTALLIKDTECIQYRDIGWFTYVVCSRVMTPITHTRIDNAHKNTVDELLNFTKNSCQLH